MSVEEKEKLDLEFGAETEVSNQSATVPSFETKFCKHCGEKIHVDAVLCTKCGRQVEELKQSNSQPTIVVNNANTNVNTVGIGGRVRNKWVALLLCFFVGWLGAHRFYEGKIISGIVYFFTFGLFGVGVVIDLIALLLKPVEYQV